MDPTLPGVPILQAYYPQVTLKAQIEAAMPLVRIGQILKAPVSAKRVIRTGNDINRKSICGYALERATIQKTASSSTPIRSPGLTVCGRKS